MNRRSEGDAVGTVNSGNMNEFVKGSSRPKNYDTIEHKVERLITSELSFMKAGKVITVVGIDNKCISLESGDFMDSNKRKWTHSYSGGATITIPIVEGLTENHKVYISGYVDIIGDECVSISNVVTIK